MIALIISLIAFGIRIYNVGLLPVNKDESGWLGVLLQQPQSIKGFIGIPLYLFPPGIYKLLSGHSPSLWPLSLDELVSYLRFTPALIGALTVYLLYLLAKQMYGKKTAVISSLMLCFLPWHIIHSRIMSRHIYMPFYGCLIFLSLFKAIQKKNKAHSLIWFVICLFFLNVSLKIYETAILFVPILLAVLMYILLKIRSYSLNVILFAAFMLGLVIFFFIPHINWMDFYRSYHNSIFKGSILQNVLRNLWGNRWYPLSQLFFTSRADSMFYGMALKAPLLIHPVMSAVCLISLFLACRRRNNADGILLLWLFLGYFLVMAAVLPQARYLSIILIPLIILTSSFFVRVFDYAYVKRGLMKFFLTFTGLFLLFWVISLEILQYAEYYFNSPYDLQECVINSSGSRDAAEYLSRLPEIKDSCLLFSHRMDPVATYLNYYLLRQGKINKYLDFLSEDRTKNECRSKIYLSWAEETHPEEEWAVLTRSEFFRQRRADIIPLRTIYYPNGLVAIRIFRIVEDGMQR